MSCSAMSAAHMTFASRSLPNATLSKNATFENVCVEGRGEEKRRDRGWGYTETRGRRYGPNPMSKVWWFRRDRPPKKGCG